MQGKNETLDDVVDVLLELLLECCDQTDFVAKTCNFLTIIFFHRLTLKIGLENCLSDLPAESKMVDSPKGIKQKNVSVKKSIAGSWKLVWTKNSNAFDGLFDKELSRNLMSANAVRANYVIKEKTFLYKRYFKTFGMFT